MAISIHKFANENNFYVLCLFLYLYVIMQTFAIPGPLILSILSGSVWGVKKGFLVTSFSATFGSACCYTLSSVFLKKYLMNSYSKKIKIF